MHTLRGCLVAPESPISLETPAGVVVQADACGDETLSGHFSVSLRWFKKAVYVNTGLALLYTAFPVVVVVQVLRGKTDSDALISPCVLAPAGLCGIWYVLATWMNRTLIEIREGRLVLENGPVPTPVVPGRVDLEMAEVRGFVAQPNPYWWKKKGGPPTWEVRVLLADDDRRLVPGLEEHVARFLAERLDAHARPTRVTGWIRRFRD